MKTHIKICGITRLEDALAAVEAGADLLGYNFFPKSPRSIPVEQCRKIQDELATRGLRVQTVGVFVNAPPSQIRQILAECDIDYAQLSGDESPEETVSLRSVAFKAVRPRSAAEALACAGDYANPGLAPALLLDAHAAGAYGGTGLRVDPQIAAALARRCDLLLAGGLRPDNVADAVQAIRPWGVDVASGVESAPGIKDPALIRQFVEQVCAAAVPDETGFANFGE